MPETDIAKPQKIVDEFIRLMNSVFTVSDKDEQEKDAVVVFPPFLHTGALRWGGLF